MTNPAFNAAVTRDTILKLLTDAETAKVSNAEDGKTLKEGESFVDLEHLDRGVQKGSTAGVVGHVLPQSAVSAETWEKIVARIG